MKQLCFIFLMIVAIIFGACTPKSQQKILPPQQNNEVNSCSNMLNTCITWSATKKIGYNAEKRTYSDRDVITANDSVSNLQITLRTPQTGTYDMIDDTAIAVATIQYWDKSNNIRYHSVDGEMNITQHGLGQPVTGSFSHVTLSPYGGGDNLIIEMGKMDNIGY